MTTRRVTTGAALLLLILGFGRGGWAAGNRLRFGHLTVEDGLSHNWVLAVIKDSYGFVWVGTQDGLNRYDGSGFVNYRSDPKDPNSLASSMSGVLYEDKQRRLWVGSSWAATGVSLFDREHDRFRKFLPAPGSPSGNVVRSISEDRQGRLWLGTDNGLARLDPANGAIERFTLRPDGERRGDVPDTTVLAVHEDRQERVWVGTAGGLLQFDRRRHEYRPWTGAGSLGRAEIWDIWEDEKGALWIASMGAGLHRLEPDTGRDTVYLPDPRDPGSISTARLTCLAADGKGKLYVGTENGGLNVLDLRAQRFSRYSPDPDDDASLNAASMWDMYVDDQGILWIGTFNGGVNFVSPLGQRFGLVRAGRGRLSDPHVSAVLKDHTGDLWVGTDGGGLNRIDARTGAVRYFHHDPRDATTIGSDSVLALTEDGQHRLWIGGWDAGLGLLDPVSGRVSRFRHDANDPSSIVSDHVRRIVELRSGELLIVTQGGVDFFDRATRRFTRLAERYPAARPEGALYSAAEDRSGNLWIVGSVSVLFLDKRTGKSRIYRNDPNDPTSLGGGEIPAVLIDSAENVWLGTDGGLSCVPADGRKMKRYTAADGLPATGVTNVLEDAAGNLWLTTNRGLTKLEEAVKIPERPAVVNFDVHDGLQGHQFARGAAFRSPDGEMFFGGSRGLNTFRPEEIRRNTAPPPIVLTGLRLFGRSVAVGAKDSPLTRSLAETEAITLSYRQSMVTIEFAALNYLLPQKNQYAYMLEPIEKRWNEATRQRSATYANLAPGNYLFRVRGANNDGAWNEKGVALRIQVTPPFWQSWWFRLLALTLGGAVALVAYRRRVQAIEQRRRELETLVERRTVELQREVQEHEATERKLAGEVAERKHAEEEAQEFAEKLGRSNVELTDGKAALERENEERRRAEEAAGQERDLLHALMDNIPDLIYFKDAGSRFVRINAAQARALGLRRPEDGLGKTDLDFLPEEYAREALRDEQNLLRTGVPLLGKVEHERRSGRWYLVTKVPLRGADGRTSGLVGVSRDITARREAEEKLSRDLAEFLQVVNAVASGDLTRRGQEDEETVGQIARSVNAMLGGFSAILSEARDAAFSVSTACSEIQAASTQIAKGAQYGSDQVHSTSSAVEEMAASMTQVSRHAEASAEKARQVLEHVQHGDRSVDATYHGITRIDAAVLETSEKMRLLERRSREIFEIIGLIQEIATQSKLLSLNAAIEAAHAGSAGRGFAIVADEIRRLADRSTQATTDVTQKIEGIVAETQAVLRAMENAMREVAEGRTLSEQARRSLRDISTLVQDSVSLAMLISTASGEQVQATKTVSDSMSSIAHVTTESAAGARESSRAVGHLVQLSEQLTEAIVRFRIDEKRDS
jgi:PAS domain S-box-containing protein